MTPIPKRIQFLNRLFQMTVNEEMRTRLIKKDLNNLPVQKALSNRILNALPRDEKRYSLVVKEIFDDSLLEQYAPEIIAEIFHHGVKHGGTMGKWLAERKLYWKMHKLQGGPLLLEDKKAAPSLKKKARNKRKR